jgi:hypothetical protein
MDLNDAATNRLPFLYEPWLTVIYPPGLFSQNMGSHPRSVFVLVQVL